MLEIKGKINTAICYASVNEDTLDEALKPIYNFKASESRKSGKEMR